MKKADVKEFFDLYFLTSGQVYASNRYVSIEKAGFKPEEEELKKIIKQRIEGVDSIMHEMNRVMLYKLINLKDKCVE
jgi:hypothetical protein